MAINNLNTGVGISPTIVDAKGDLIVATGADAVNRLAVGTANQQLVVDSSTATGLKWAAPAGLVLLNTTSFSGVSSQTVSNVFSSTYDNYVIIFNAGSGSTTTAISMQLGATNTGYYQFGVFGRYNAATVLGDNKSNNSAIVQAATADTNGLDGICHIFAPNLAKTTTFETRSRELGSTTGLVYNSGGFINNQTQYTAFTVTPASGTITGSISTYGFNK